MFRGKERVVRGLWASSGKSEQKGNTVHALRLSMNCLESLSNPYLS